MAQLNETFGLNWFRDHLIGSIGVETIVYAQNYDAYNYDVVLFNFIDSGVTRQVHRQTTLLPSEAVSFSYLISFLFFVICVALNLRYFCKSYIKLWRNQTVKENAKYRTWYEKKFGAKLPKRSCLSAFLFFFGIDSHKLYRENFCRRVIYGTFYFIRNIFVKIFKAVRTSFIYCMLGFYKILELLCLIQNLLILFELVKVMSKLSFEDELE